MRNGCYEYINTYKQCLNPVGEGQPAAYADYRREWGTLTASPEDHPATPYQIDIDVIDACNIRCSCCFDRTRQRNYSAMTMETAAAIAGSFGQSAEGIGKTLYRYENNVLAPAVERNDEAGGEKGTDGY